jgi:hypothetical protein
MNPRSSHRRCPTPCGIVAHALVEARLSEIPGLRDAPGTAGGPILPPRFLRHCDEQTVVGLHAVLRGLAASGRPVEAFARHAVVAAPCHAGRFMAAKSLAGMRQGGAVMVSTHVVPQASLHSIAGAVSVGLGLHGPHIGVSGGPDALAEGLLAAVSLLEAGTAGDTGGVWLVATAWDTEPPLDAEGTPLTDPLLRGLAIGIEAGADAFVTLSLEERDVDSTTRTDADVDPAAAIQDLALALSAGGERGVSWSLACAGTARLRAVVRPRTASRAGREAA